MSDQSLVAQGQTSYPLLQTREWVTAVFIAIVAALLLLIPYYLGYTFSTNEHRFTGILMNPEDTQTYFAKMLQGYDGYWLYTIPFTAEPHNGAFVGGFYLVLGHLARLTGLSPMMMWHVVRFAADVILFVVTFYFISAFITESRTRWLAYLLAIFGSGLGWLLFLFNQPYWLDAFPVDFKQPGSHLFFTALTFPHVAVGTAVTLLSILWLKQAADGRWQYGVAAGFINIILGIAYPFLIYLVGLTAVLYYLYLVWQQRRILWREGIITAVAFLIPAPLYVYYAYVLQTNAVFRAWDVQAATLSPPWPHYLLAYGIMLLMAGLYAWKRPSTFPRFAILWAWFLAVALLVYAPLNPQRRFVQGVQVPLAVLTAVFFTQLFIPWLERRRFWQALLARPRYSADRMARFTAVLFLLFMSLSNLYLFASVSLSAVVQQPDPLFRPQAEMDAAQWLRENVPETAVILSSYQTGSYIAGQAGQRVVLGHWAETVDYDTKAAQVEQFFAAATSDAWRQEFLRQNRVDYIWFSPREQDLGTFSLGEAGYLHTVYANDEVTIYRVGDNS
ncbi:MAG: hypothetical protein H6667_03420 [Ardenticatenaceae bacterium]|nr:hypothetical protein [Ardenticatenaceae bacterium]MCB9443058.1 hypothetical protein [Ardenticatenaceae bacterium]